MSPKVEHSSSSGRTQPVLNSIKQSGSTRARGLEILPKTSMSATPSLRRRKLGPVADNPLLRPLSSALVDQDDEASIPSSGKGQSCVPRVQLRARKAKPAPATTSVQRDAHDGEITFVEEASVDDISEFQAGTESDLSGSDDDFLDAVFSRPKPRKITSSGDTIRRKREEQKQSRPGVPRCQSRTSPCEPTPRLACSDNMSLDTSYPAFMGGEGGSPPSQTNERNRDAITDGMARIHLGSMNSSPSTGKERRIRPATPEVQEPKSRPARLTSPKKLPHIPKTPHRPSTDMFWSREFVDDWNDEHSLKKLLFPTNSKSPSKSSPRKNAADRPALAKQAKKAFEKAKHEMATRFLQELDSTITEGRLSELAASTGGIRINWTNKLNTTAGRANWKKETVRKKSAASGDSEANDTIVAVRHYASIDLAEKVIDDEHRLLNVIAHEFCHLANFMISGITGSPHGSEFKAWAAQCSRSFGDRGIVVTTRHSYDIDFKYVWACDDCGTEYKRHSKSIQPDRHRCGSCKGALRQTKPVPRRTAAGVGDGTTSESPAVATKKPSEYQIFMKEQMKLTRQEHPKSPQKDIMRMVAEKWSRRTKEVTTRVPAAGVDDVSKNLAVLTLSEQQ
ncbi:hypothetical protein VTK73DRAFT_6817 [Phialemonium thermophilum]|uniref:SprT-like domain-containing protein n=1 Tax=Phialemonium thermophilum TaxID=223376 RepID=A0ABR3Y7W3_9PEZI